MQAHRSRLGGEKSSYSQRMTFRRATPQTNHRWSLERLGESEWRGSSDPGGEHSWFLFDTEIALLIGIAFDSNELLCSLVMSAAVAFLTTTVGSVGATEEDVRLQFLIEALVLGLIGGTVHT